MQLVWQQGECSAPELHEAISTQKDASYSTVKTIIDRLETKGALHRTRRVGRTIFYSTDLSPDEIRGSMLERFITHVFGGDRKPLFNHLLNDGNLSADDLKYLEQLLAKNRAQHRD